MKTEYPTSDEIRADFAERAEAEISRIAVKQEKRARIEADPPLSMLEASKRLGVDRETLNRAVEGDSFLAPADHSGTRGTPRYFLADVCESLAAHRWRVKPRMSRRPGLDNEGLLPGEFEAHEALGRSGCPLCGFAHEESSHPPEFYPSDHQEATALLKILQSAGYRRSR